jgi:hypothetical protein
VVAAGAENPLFRSLCDPLSRSCRKKMKKAAMAATRGLRGVVAVQAFSGMPARQVPVYPVFHQRRFK